HTTMESTLLHLAAETEKLLTEADIQIKSIRAIAEEKKRAHMNDSLKEQKLCEDKISKLSSYKSQYRNYISSVHDLFEKELKQQKLSYIQQIKKEYQALVKKYNAAVAAEKDPYLTGSTSKFNFIKSFYNSIVDTAEEGEGLSGVINTLTGIAYALTLGVMMYAFYLTYTGFEAIDNTPSYESTYITELVETTEATPVESATETEEEVTEVAAIQPLPAAPGNSLAAHFLEAPFYQIVIWATLGISLLTLILKIIKRKGYISDANSRAILSRAQQLEELRNKVVQAEQEMQNYRNRHSMFFDKNGNCISPPTENIKFSREKTFDILSDVKKKVSMNIDTSLFKETYTFSLYTSSYSN
ncbi:MAG: hypothetical protein LIP08_02245, partial [Bacteroides sp.]|nr:hypothetical protein [Bacteroides sp.]